MLVTLEDLPESDDNADTESDLMNTLKLEGEKLPSQDCSTALKVESLIGRMDRFMHCFATLQATTSKNQKFNDKKFKLLETTHNTLATKVPSATSSNKDKIEELERQLKDSTSANAALSKKVDQLAEVQARQIKVNEDHSKSIKNLGIEQGFIVKNVNDCFSEVKERKMILSAVEEFQGENVSVVALGCINKVIQTAITLKQPDAHRGGLRKLRLDALDKVFRIGKAGKNRKRNISVTFVRIEDKEMVFKAKSDTKNEDGFKFFMNEDATVEGRSLKSKLKRVVSAATTLGRDAKLAGNRVIVDSRSYSSDELSLLPKDVIGMMKQEKEIDDGIVYRGEYSTLSNFSPAPFTVDDISYVHVEQHYQSSKALHHGEVETANRIMNMSNPLRIKSLGDSIEGDALSIKRRMLVLYDRVRAKFEQSLKLQEELLATEGKHLYEATTDPYFGCGIGFDSKRWQSKDWSGENVAGLVVRKVRDELLGLAPETIEKSNTLVDIASQEEIDPSSEMEVTSLSSKDTGGAPENENKSSQSTGSLPHRSHSEHDLSQKTHPNSSTSSALSQRSRGKGCGRGKGRARGRKGPSDREPTSLSTIERG